MASNSNEFTLRLKAIKLRNFRCFKALSVDFHPDLTVLVANNGQGKTSVLDAAAIALGPYVGAFDDGKDRYFSKDDIRLIRDGESNSMELAEGGVAIEADGVIEHKHVAWTREMPTLKARKRNKGVQVLINYAEKLQRCVRHEAENDRSDEAASGISPTSLPLVAYYPTDRLWNVRRLPYKKLPRTSRMVGYTHSLESGSDFHLMADWIRYWSTNALKRKVEAQATGTYQSNSVFDNALEAVRKAVNTCLAPAGWGNFDFSLAREELVATHPDHGELPAAVLSDGIRSMLTLVADIAFRIVKLNPNLGPFAVTQTTGIVLIDEIDMHLHPSWQQTVLGSLREAFPRIQFIVTTHSPQVVTSVPTESIRILSENGVSAAPAGTEGAESSRALKQVFSVETRPPNNDATKELLRYLALVDKGEWDSPDARTLRGKLDKRYQGEEPALYQADLIIENQKWERGQ